jgi:cadmium resistance protein CadD (predicted permease)
MGNEVLSTLAVASVVFVATDVDDLLLLLALFADPALHRRAVVLGQFLGIALLVLASALIALSVMRVSREYAALSGLAPLAFGLWRLRGLCKSQDCRGVEDSDARARSVKQRIPSQVIMVTALTIASGGDNLVAYVPLFAAAPSRIPVYAGVFATLTAAWCAIAYLCVNNRIVHVQARRYGHAALPLVMVILGLWTLSGMIRRAG